MIGDVDALAAGREPGLRPKLLGVPIPEPVVSLGRAGFRGLGMATADLRPMPDFLLIGAKRAGTTSLFFDLLQNPAIMAMFPSARIVPKARDGKGPHYFDSEYHRGDRWYRAHFATEWTRRRAARTLGPVVTGEASPYYLFHPLAPARAAQALPDGRFVVLLRDPVQRTISHYQERRRQQMEPLATLEEALAAEPTRLHGHQEALIRGDLARSYPHEHQGYLLQSRYHLGIRRWLGQIRRDQLLVLDSRDYYRNPQHTCDLVFDFLGIAGHQIRPAPPRNATTKTEVDPATRAFLQDELRDGVHELQDLLEMRFDWAWV
ncbi:MAG: sulfotransferase domain-containing protein [Actinomycetales bacterium]